MTDTAKADTVRLLEASVESLFLSLVGLAIPRRNAAIHSSALYAAEIGLIGVAAELAMSACLVECYGLGYLVLGNGHFKSGGQILDDFRNLIQKDKLIAAPLLKDIPDVSSHLDELLAQTVRFRVLIASRAAGLHAGHGQNHAVATVAAHEVSQFLQSLGKSALLKNHLTSIPQPPNVARERSILLEDLLREIGASDDQGEQASLVRSIFLVLPDIPDNMPDWIDRFDNLTIAPEKTDIAFLLDVLEKAHPVSLTRQSTVGSVLPVRVVQQDNPQAVPVSLSDIRREFTQIKEQWFSHAASSNGHIRDGMLHLPPDEFVVRLFVNGVDSIGIAEPGASLPAQQTWPFILSSNNVPGTPRPYWFLVRKTDDLHQLTAFIRKWSGMGGAHLRKNTIQLLDGMSYMQKGVSLAKETTLYAEMINLYKRALSKRSSIEHALNRHKGNKRAATGELTRRIGDILNGKEQMGNLLTDIVNERVELTFDSRRFWSTLLAEASLESSDAIGLFAIVRSGELVAAHTQARKSLRLIDFLQYGPSTDIREKVD